MKRKVFIFWTLVAIICIQCGKQKLLISRQDYFGNDLRTDGIYYNKYEKAHFFLYRNGVFFDGGTGFKGSLNELIEFYSDDKNYITGYEIPYRWGVFIIENNNIQIEKWVSSDAFGRYTTTLFDGEIINDTALLINHPASTIGRDTFYFQQTLQKPDSTNKFIK